jgi:hypothetical protein
MLCRSAILALLCAAPAFAQPTVGTPVRVNSVSSPTANRVETTVAASRIAPWKVLVAYKIGDGGLGYAVSTDFGATFNAESYLTVSNCDQTVLTSQTDPQAVASHTSGDIWLTLVAQYFGPRWSPAVARLQPASTQLDAPVMARCWPQFPFYDIPSLGVGPGPAGGAETMYLFFTLVGGTPSQTVWNTRSSSIVPGETWLNSDYAVTASSPQKGNGPFAAVLPSGRVVVAYNDATDTPGLPHQDGRLPTAWYSDDGGQTWTRSVGDVVQFPNNPAFTLAGSAPEPVYHYDPVWIPGAGVQGNPPGTFRAQNFPGIWSDPTHPPSPGEPNSGWVYVCFLGTNPTSNHPQNVDIYVALSKDGGPTAPSSGPSWRWTISAASTCSITST